MGHRAAICVEVRLVFKGLVADARAFVVVKPVGQYQETDFLCDLSEQQTRTVDVLRVAIVRLSPRISDIDVRREVERSFKVEDEIEMSEKCFLVVVLFCCLRMRGEASAVNGIRGLLDWWLSGKFDEIGCTERVHAAD